MITFSTPTMYSKLARTATLAALTASAVFFATASQAHPVYVNDGGVIQGPRLMVAPPIYVQRPVVVSPPAYVVTRPVNHQHGRVYYIHGRPYLNGHPYRAQYRHHGHKRHHDRHHGYDESRHHGHHDQGRHAGWNR